MRGNENCNLPPYSIRVRGRKNTITARSTQRARRLRKQSTDAERTLWRLLRNRQLDGRKFRRQVPLGPYIVDFFCHERSLVIEIDGGQHQARAAADRARTRRLEAQGYRVIRFWNNEVLREPEAVQAAILAELRREA